ncbi:MAG: ferredoxin, partial [Deltaproteobacteria bacterium]|nr:ferredoxin [Deltaproteobacteria bacterium]
AAVGLFDEGGRRFVAAVSKGEDGPVLRRFEAPAVVVATGGYPALLPFENNDLPGVYAGAAVAVLLRRHGIRVGDTVACVGEGPGLHLLARALREAGAEVPLVLQLSGELPPDALPTARVGTPQRASGLHHVKALRFSAGGVEDRVACDAVAVVLPPSPALELARQGGAQVQFLEAWNVFAVQAAPDGATGVPGLYAAGHVTGPMTAAEALSAGARAGKAAAEWLRTREAA